MNKALEEKYDHFTLWDLKFNLEWLEQSQSEVLKRHAEDLRVLIAERERANES